MCRRGLRGGLEGAERGVDVFLPRAGERRHAAGLDFAGHGAHGFEIAGRGDGKAGFDDVHAQVFELARQSGAFRPRFMEKPGDCSPSRSVVSKMCTVSISDSFPMLA